MDQELFEYLQTYLTDRRKRLFAEVLAQRTRHFTVVTQGVYQLHNTSAVLRSCDIFGIQDLHIVHDNRSKRIDKQIAMGAQKWVDVNRYETAMECIETLRAGDYRIIATTPHSPTVSLKDFDVKPRAAFFFGKEDTGLSQEVLENADDRLAISMYGFTESLNISVSAAIILREVVERMRETQVKWQLSAEESRQIEIDWTRRSIKHVDAIIERYHLEKKA